MKLQKTGLVLFVFSAALILHNPAAVAQQGEDYSIADQSDHPTDDNRNKEGSRSWLADTKGAASQDRPQDKKSDLISAEVVDVLSPNEIEVTVLGKNHVIKLAGVKDCPCDFNEQATKMAHAETKASRGFLVVDAGTIVRRCREIKEFLKGKTADEVLIRPSGGRRSSSVRFAGVVRNKGESKTLNDAVLAYAEKQHAIEKKKNQHQAYKKFHSKNK